MDTLFTFRVEKANDKLLMETTYPANDFNQIINNPNCNRMISTEATEVVVEPSVEQIKPVETQEIAIPLFGKKLNREAPKTILGTTKTYRKPRANARTTNLFPTEDLWILTSHLNAAYTKTSCNLSKINWALMFYAIGRTQSNDKAINVPNTVNFEIPQNLKIRYSSEQLKQAVKYTLGDGTRLNENKCQLIVPGTFSKKELDIKKIRKDFLYEVTELKIQPCDLFNFYATEGVNYIYENNSELFKFVQSEQSSWKTASTLTN